NRHLRITYTRILICGETRKRMKSSGIIDPDELVEAQPSTRRRFLLTRGSAVIGILLLLAIVFNATSAGYAQFLGGQGWGIVLGGPGASSEQALLNTIRNKLRQQATPGATATAQQQETAQQYINLILQGMTLDQKLGQMMIVQFLGPTYTLAINTMISQYDVGAALLYSANGNIQSKTQLKGLIAQMQQASGLSMLISIDQEGGYVDRLVNLDGPRPSAASIGATNDPAQALVEGERDAADLSSYGFNLNLAPVVDVTTVPNPQLFGRTFGDTPDSVTRMAAAYLQGLQQSGKVFGTLKHFPGLGDVATDPHNGVPDVYRSLAALQAIDWAPYRALIAQGNVHAVMVTHEVIHAVDPNLPSSLSYKLVTGILRDQLGFNGVIMTDSLTMQGLTAFYSEAQAAALAIEAGDDLLMGASTPQDVAAMIEGIKQVIASNGISMARIDDSVRRILTLKFELGLLPLPNN
ncbi:MAG TPA: glycoside hydrolase family 3 N-terminal domain-containing protein, partial [Ktedonobacteraceae bacterium]|nr:glycoside hydrolase family 3 N-terminal domain-containing protein [Ktedonobacteraceae bacterium]